MIRRSARSSAAFFASLALCACAANATSPPKGWSATVESVPVRLAEVGTWQMAAMKLNEQGEPECFESWTFKKDGTGTLTSGEQSIALSWSYETDPDLDRPLLLKSYQSSEGSPDCLGRDVDQTRYPKTNGKGFALLFFGDGAGAYVCNPPHPITLPNGTKSTLQTLDNCWGTITPAEG